jgi:hypothetical protein
MHSWYTAMNSAGYQSTLTCDTACSTESGMLEGPGLAKNSRPRGFWTLSFMHFTPDGQTR